MADLNDLEKRMEGAFSMLQKDLSGLRTGRASASLVDSIRVEVYGQPMPLNQVATVNVPEPRMISLQVWDKSNVAAVEKAIMNADLGLNPSTDGTLIRLPVPSLTEERRKEMVKIGSQFAEKARVSVRNVRRDGMEHIKKEQKDHVISEDEAKAKSDKVQQLTDKYIKKIDDAYAAKEKEVLHV